MIDRLRGRLPGDTQRRLTRAMQGALVVLFAWGIWANQPKAVTNSLVGLGVTLAPAVFERNSRVALDPFLTLWLTTAVVLHTLGSAGLYASLGWWDHLTHAASASFVAAIGYIGVRAIDVHHEEVQLPTQFFAVFVVLFVLAFGVVWELFEFALDVISFRTGIRMPLAQFGLDDTVRDLMFNTAGAVIVGIWGQAYLYGLGERLVEALRAAD
ncbi:hypothetical protein GCM10027435_17100 [Haloparvum alkalitolerans]